MTPSASGMTIEEYRFGNAIVRIHPGERTPDERRAAIEEAAVWFLKEIEKQRKGRNERCRTRTIRCMTSICTKQSSTDGRSATHVAHTAMSTCRTQGTT